MEIFEILQQSSCFQDLDANQIAYIAPLCTEVVLGDGDFLIKEGEHDRDFFLLLSGKVEIVANNSDLISNEIVLSKYDKDIYGELAWLTDCKRTASARCRGDVEAIKIDGERMMSFLKDNPEVGFKVMYRIALVISQRMEQSDGMLKQILWLTNI